MAAVLDYLRQFNFVTVVFRLLLALLAGGAVGYGRARKQRNAGLRTYMLVSVGAALTILISMYEYEMLYNGAWAWANDIMEIRFDASRFAAQVITGVGFLAAGTILAVSHQQVSGLTSAIGLFVAACFGLAAGAGFYELLLIAVVMVIIAMEAMQPLEVNFKRRIRNITLFVEFDESDDVGVITDALEDRGAHIYDVNIERAQREGDNYPSAIFSMKLSKEKASHSEVLSSVAEMDCVHSVQELIS